MENLIFNFNKKKIESKDETTLCAIINVTPDSFSDGGKYFGVQKAVNRAKELIKDGAKMLDIGGESTRPGSSFVEIKDEINRVCPVIKEIRKFTDIAISVDTWKAEVAKEALNAGADIVNDITGFLGDKNMAKVVSKTKAGAILMFNPVIARANHEGSKIFPKFSFENLDDLFKEYENLPITQLMEKYFLKSLEIARKNNISKDRIMLDPGIGFGLTKRENFILIKNLEKIHNMGYPIFLGVSRKRFITNILQENGFNIDKETTQGLTNMDNASSNLSFFASLNSVEAIRVHEIKPHLLAVKIAQSIKLAEKMENINFKSYN